ncbi:MAG: hypothetical protein V3R84_07690 [Acidimicrobiia bacterium]
MAFVYNRGKTNVGTVWDWDDPGTPFRLMLVTSTYVYDADHNVRSDITNEITNTGYTSGGDAITARAVSQNDATNEAEYDGADLTFAGIDAGDQPAAAIVYRDTGAAATDDLVCYLSLSAAAAPDGSPYQILFDAAALFKITD